MFCGQCGTKTVEQNDFCTNCGRRFFEYTGYFPLQKKATTKEATSKKEQQTEQSINNWTDLYQSAKESSKKKTRKKVKEEKLGEYEKGYLKRLKKKPRKRVTKKEKEDKPEKYVSSPVLPQSSTFSFSSNRLLPLVVVGFVLGLVTFIFIGAAVAGTSDPYGCTICDPFHPDYDGPPPIEMDLWVPDDYYYDDNYYYDDYYYP